MQLAGTDLRDEGLVAALLGVTVYYFMRADLRRASHVHELLHTHVDHESRRWFRPVLETGWGLVACLRGEYDTARAHFEAAIDGQTTEDRRDVEAVWFVTGDQITNAYIHLGMIDLFRGDLVGARVQLARARDRAEQLGFPQRPFSLAYTRSFDIRACIEAGQFEDGASIAAELLELSEKHGLDLWLLFGATMQACVDGMAALDTDDVDPTTLQTHIATITALLDTWRVFEVNMYRTFFDCYAGRLLIAAGRLDEARACLDAGLKLADDTGMCFYDAELLRLRARTHPDPDAREADLAAALALARGQGATLFELRSALDDFELRGPEARSAVTDVVSRMPTDYEWPELARAQAHL